MEPIKEDKTVVLSLKLKALEDQMTKTAVSSLIDANIYRQHGEVYKAAKELLETVEILEDAGLEHSDAMMISVLHSMRQRR